MRSISHREHRERRGKQKLSLLFSSVISVAISFFAYGCSIPNLEKPECTEARDAVKQFYSFHFGNDMHPSAENLKMRERFLTPKLYERLSNQSPGAVDYFTGSDNYPRTFKIGACRANNHTDTDFNLQIYWRDDSATVQKTILVNAVEIKSEWKIDSVQQ